jgi:hypothetical protein
VSVTSLVDSGLTNDVTYTWVVRAVNAAGTGAASPEASATPFAPTATLTWASNGDANGVFYWLGSARGLGSWANPLRAGYASGSASSVSNGCSNADATASCDPGWTTNRNVGTTANKPNADDVPVSTGTGSQTRVTYDLGGDHALKLNRYALRGRCDSTASYPRYWTLQGSNDAVTWTQLDFRAPDTTIASRCAWASWTVSTTSSYRYFRVIVLTPPYFNSLSTSDVTYDEVEFYGTVTYVPRTAPVTPAGFVVTNVSKGNQLSWNAVTGALSYNLFRSSDGVTFTLLASGVTTTSYAVTGLTPNSNHHYRVQASNLGGVSAQSASVMGTALP